MKVLHVSSALTWRGGEQQIAYLLQELKALGVINQIFCPHETPLAEMANQNSFKFHTYKKNNLDPRISKRLKLLCIQEQIDLIHLHDSHSHTYGVMAASLYGLQIPMILSRRVDFPIKGSIFSKWKYNHPSIKKILCVSRAIKKILARDVRDTSKLEIVYSGVDLSRIKRRSEILHTEYSLLPNQLIIGNIASIAPHKDYFTFVNVVHKLKSKNTIDPFPKFFIIGGDGGEQFAIKKKIETLGLEHDIILTGFRNDIPAIVSDLDVMLVTSKEEGLCTSIIDAFGAGVPVVATAAGGIPELVLHLQTGLLAPVKDVDKLVHWVEKILSDNQLKARIVKKAKMHATQFSQTKMASDTYKYYSSSLLK